MVRVVLRDTLVWVFRALAWLWLVWLVWMHKSVRCGKCFWSHSQWGLVTGCAEGVLALRKVLSGLGRGHCVRHVPKVVGLDGPVRARAGRHAPPDDLGNAARGLDGHHLAPVGEEGLPFTLAPAQRSCRGGKEVHRLVV